MGLDRLILAHPFLNRNLIAGISHEDRHRYVVDANVGIQADRVHNIALSTEEDLWGDVERSVSCFICRGSSARVPDSCVRYFHLYICTFVLSVVVVTIGQTTCWSYRQ